MIAIRDAEPPYAALVKRPIVLAPGPAAPATAVFLNSSRRVVRSSATSAYASSMRWASGVRAMRKWSIQHSHCEFKSRHPLQECVARGTNRLALRRAAAQPAQAVLDSHRGPVSTPRRIDALDQGIIEALQANGRESFRAIAARLGVSE